MSNDQTKYQDNYDWKDLEQDMEGNWGYLFEDLAPNLAAALAKPGHHVPCPVHGGVDGFRLFPDFATKGNGICNTCGGKRGAGMLAWVNGWSYKEAVKETFRWYKGDTQITPVAQRPPVKEYTPPDPTVAKARIENARQESVDLRGTPAELYLKNRGIWVQNMPKILRAHMQMPYYHGKTKTHYGKLPCLMAPITNDRQEVHSLHRIFVDEHGNKAKVPDPKYMMTKCASLKGCSIKLEPLNSKKILGFAEGIETACATMAIANEPVWATVSAILMEQVHIPDGPEEIDIWADLDVSKRGEQAANVLKARVLQASKRCNVFYPPVDYAGFCELYTGARKEALIKNQAQIEPYIADALAFLHGKMEKSKDPSLKGVDWLDVLNCNQFDGVDAVMLFPEIRQNFGKNGVYRLFHVKPESTVLSIAQCFESAYAVREITKQDVWVQSAIGNKFDVSLIPDHIKTVVFWFGKYGSKITDELRQALNTRGIQAEEIKMPLSKQAVLDLYVSENKRTALSQKRLKWQDIEELRGKSYLDLIGNILGELEIIPNITWMDVLMAQPKGQLVYKQGCEPVAFAEPNLFFPEKWKVRE